MSRAGTHPAFPGGARALRPFALPLALALAAPLALSGCGQNDTDPGPGGVTVGEAKALDQAAEMLEQQRRAPATDPTPEADPTPAT